MIRPRALFLLAVAAAPLGVLSPSRVSGQEQFQYETDLVAKRRIFESVGAGFRTIRRGPGGTYYILTAPAPALFIYDGTGKRVGQVPAAATKGAALVYGDSFDVDREGRVAVCDRGATSVKLYSRDGALLVAIPISIAASVALLPSDEVAVVTPGLDKLVTVYDLNGKVVRDYGEPEQIADAPDVNRLANFGHILSDDSSNTYLAFDFLPEPTMRKFDSAGYLSAEISLATLEFQAPAQAARRVIAGSDRASPALHRIITAIGLDPQSQDVWLAIGTQLMQFDKDGKRLATFRTYMPGGARLESISILVEPTRLLIGSDAQGIYEFLRPGKNSP
jgi:hypothetical protein